MSDPADLYPKSPSKTSTKESVYEANTAPLHTRPWYRVAVDANFFILAFAQNPEALTRFKQITDQVYFKLYTSPQILRELRWNLRRRVKRVVEIVNITKKELTAYINKAKKTMDRIPQAPDLSLLLVLKKLREKRLVSSDFHLLQSLRSLDPEIEGLMGSAFLLHLLERSTYNEKDALFLEELRERVLHTEIKYSLTRSSVFDPTTRIKLIENQAFHVVRSLRGPRIAEEDLIGMTEEEALGLRQFLQELRRQYSSFVQEIQTQNYRVALNEIETAREELYSHLVILSWELSANSHRRLIRHITPDLVLLNYFAALCHLYLGEAENLQEAKKAIDECNRILLTVRPAATNFRRLMVMTHLLRITINLLLEDFEAATMYFTMFSRKCQEWGFTKEQTTAQALYLALLVIRGEITSTEFPLITDPEEVIRFLVDLASLYFMLRRFNEAWSLLRQILYIIQYFKLYDMLELTIRLMILIYYADGRQRKEEFATLSTQLEKWLQSNKYETDIVKQIQTELTEQIEAPSKYFTETSVSANKLHPDFRDWMTVIDRVDTVLLQGSILICRSWKLPWNVALLIQGVLREEKAKGGEQVRLGEGKFKVTHPPPTLKQRYRILSLVHADPTGKSRIYVRGVQGSRLLQLGPLLEEAP